MIIFLLYCILICLIILISLAVLIEKRSLSIMGMIEGIGDLLEKKLIVILMLAMSCSICYAEEMDYYDDAEVREALTKLSNEGYIIKPISFDPRADPNMSRMLYPLGIYTKEQVREWIKEIRGLGKGLVDDKEVEEDDYKLIFKKK